MEGVPDQVIVLILESEDGPTDETIAELEDNVQDIFNSEPTVDPMGRGMMVVNSDGPAIDEESLDDTLKTCEEYSIADHLITTVEYIDSVRELLNE